MIPIFVNFKYSYSDSNAQYETNTVINVAEEPKSLTDIRNMENEIRDNLDSISYVRIMNYKVM